MPRIEPIPMDQLSAAFPPHRGSRSRSGPLRHAGAVADLRLPQRRNSPGRHGQDRTSGPARLLGGRILELLRIRSAQLGECEPCSQSRKHDSITDEDVACLLAPAARRFDTAGADGRRIPRPAVRRPPRHRRRVLPAIGQSTSPRRRSSNSDSPAPRRWDCTASCTPSTCTATRVPSSATPPTKSILAHPREPS